ncbi:unnamed protein product [Chironomus riparius]|uniref:Uncharacterized protein n=1 Tax=Chironomus riparius TaxID=315576 RepID=A0A9N9WYL0_9DIPT|nr:unnamed protein product [Chironomus riparius]
MIKLWILFFTFVHLISSTSPTDINCSYVFYTFTVVGYTYHCDIRYDPNIISEETAVINQARGTHESHKTDDDVTGFYSSSKKIEIFPRDLEKVFKNLKLIVINYGRLTNIHQADLKPFKNLENLNLAYNDIKVINEGLFDFNLDLAYISLSNNKIYQIHPEVFTPLTKLSYLSLETNVCIDIRVDNSVRDVMELIKKIKVSCVNGEIKSTAATELSDLKNLTAQILSTGADTNEKIENLQQAVKATDINLQSFKSEVLAALQKILDKIEENSVCLKASQDKVDIALNDEMTNIEAGLSALESETEEQKKAVDNLSGDIF